jgi:hypothetical protein
MANVVAWIVGLTLPISLFVVGFALYESRGIVGAGGAGNALMLVGVALVGVMIVVVTRSPIGVARQAQWQVREWRRLGHAQRQGANGSLVPLVITLYEQVAAPLNAFAAKHGLTLEEAVNRILAEHLEEPDREG